MKRPARLAGTTIDELTSAIRHQYLKNCMLEASAHVVLLMTQGVGRSPIADRCIYTIRTKSIPRKRWLAGRSNDRSRADIGDRTGGSIVRGEYGSHRTNLRTVARRAPTSPLRARTSPRPPPGPPRDLRRSRGLTERSAVQQFEGLDLHHGRGPDLARRHDLGGSIRE